MDEEIKEKTSGRPVFLYILCVLSVLSNFFSIIISILLLIGGKTNSFLETIPVIDIITEEIKHGNFIYYIIKITVHLFCIFAVLLLARKLRKGFIFYIVSQAILLIIPWIFLLSLGMYYLLMSTVISLIFSLFFIMLFALYLPKKAKQI
jgi:hypothetical protein